MAQITVLAVIYITVYFCYKHSARVFNSGEFLFQKRYVKTIVLADIHIYGLLLLHKLYSTNLEFTVFYCRGLTVLQRKIYSHFLQCRVKVMQLSWSHFLSAYGFGV